MFNEDYLVSDSSYSEVMTKTVIPWLEARERTLLLSGYDNDPIFTVSYEAEEPVGTVFLIHGFTENAFK